MPVRAWQLVAALELTLATSSLADPPEHYRAERQRENAAEEQQAQAQGIEDTRPASLNWLDRQLGVEGCGPYPVDRLGRADDVSKEQYYTDCDLEAQESVANSTRWLLILAGPQFALTIIATYLLWRSLGANRKATKAAIRAARAARRANTIARAANAVDQRAWLWFGEPKFIEAYLGEDPDSEAGKRVWIKIEFVVTNSGATPAIDVGVGCIAGRVGEEYSPNLVQHAREVAHEVGRSANFIAPGEARTIRRTLPIEVGQVQRSIGEPEWNAWVALYLIVGYGIVSGQERQETSSEFTLFERSPIPGESGNIVWAASILIDPETGRSRKADPSQIVFTRGRGHMT